MKYSADECGTAVFRPVGDVVPPELDAAGIGDETPSNGIEEGRFAGSIRADEDGKCLRLEM